MISTKEEKLIVMLQEFAFHVQVICWTQKLHNKGDKMTLFNLNYYK
jgi:hypothetical protein